MTVETLVKLDLDAKVQTVICLCVTRGKVQFMPETLRLKLDNIKGDVHRVGFGWQVSLHNAIGDCYAEALIGNIRSMVSS